MERTYAAFISYRHARLDSAVAKTLHTLIEQYRIPKDLRPEGQKKMGIVFRDQEELHASSDLSAEISFALKNAQFLIVICSENTAHSPWVSREIETFLKTHDRSRIFTVLASGEPADVFPAQLTRIEGEDGSIQLIEPLAVDVRASSLSGMRRKLSREIPRLIAAMLDCPYDALVMREQKRKTRRILGISAAVMAVLLGFTSMLVVKNQQIEQRNVELARQKAEVQLRESQLLTEDARDALNNGDYMDAIENAVAALPKSSEDSRPYYAPAESVLMESMNVFSGGDTPVILNTTQLDQMTDISEFRISEDGTRVVTIDPYGSINCFSADSGRLLWNRTAASSQGEAFHKHRNLLMLPGQSRIVSFFCGSLEAFDLQTGDSLWRLELPDSIGNYLFCTDAGDTLLLLESAFDESGRSAVRLRSVRTSDGEPGQAIPIRIPEEGFNGIYTYLSSSIRAGGMFSRDGSRFWGVFFDNNYYLYVFSADLALGTAEVIYRHNSPAQNNATVSRLSADDRGRLLLAVHNLADDTASLLSLDPGTGELIWQRDIPGEEGSFSFLYDNSHVLYTDNHMILGFYDRICSLDLETGEMVASSHVPGVITCLYSASDSTFGFGLANGIYGLGWLYTDGTMALTTGADYQVYATVSPHQTMQVWGGGIVQMQVNGGFGLSVSNAVCPGYVALIPEDAENTLQIIRPVQMEPAVERSFLEIPGKILSASSGCSALCAGGKLILGPLQETDPETYESREVYLILDAGTREILHIWSPEEYIFANELFWIPDSLSRVECDFYGDITLTTWDGQETVLSSDEDSVVQTSDGFVFTGYLLRSASAYLAEDSSLLCAKTTLDSLVLWRNGELSETVPMPPQTACPPEACTGRTRFLTIGANGFVLVSCHPDNSPAPSSSMAVYDSSNAQWLSLPESFSCPNSDAITFARSSALMAVLDSDGNLRILDLATQSQTAVFPALIPTDAVGQMDFLLNDTCLMIKSQDGQILICDVSTGEILYRDQVSSSYGGRFQTYVDAANQRLYIALGINYSNPDGICVELGSWTRLGYIDKLLFFDEETGILYQSGFANKSSHCSYTAIPGTAQLVQIGSEMLEQSK